MSDKNMDISKLPLGTLQPLRCPRCGTTHDLLSGYDEAIARIHFRAIRDCPICSKEKTIGVHEALHEEYPMLENCIKCQDDENAQAANS